MFCLSNSLRFICNREARTKIVGRIAYILIAFKAFTFDEFKKEIEKAQQNAELFYVVMCGRANS